MSASGPLIGAWADSTFPILTDVLYPYPGDLVLCHTDGLADARRAGECFGPQRIADAVRATAGSHERAVDAVLAAVDAGGFARHDDLALLALRLPAGE